MALEDANQLRSLASDFFNHTINMIDGDTFAFGPAQHSEQVGRGGLAISSWSTSTY